VARNLTITAAEWASVTDGTLWIVREGEHPDCDRTYPCIHAAPDEPAEFVAACAPCETCDDTRNLRHFDPCPDCRIELVGPCVICADEMPTHNPIGPYCTHTRRTLSYAYAVGQPLPIIHLVHALVGQPSWPNVQINGPDCVTHSDGPDLAAALAHYGPLESLVGKWALQLAVARG